MEFLTDHVVFVVVLPVVIGLLSLPTLYNYLTAARRVFDAPLEGAGQKQSKISANVNLHTILRDNYRKYRNRFFKVRQPYGDVVIVPPKYIEELKSLPEGYVSFEEINEHRFNGKYTLLSAQSVGGTTGTIVKSVATNLTRSLNSLMEDIHAETEYAFEKHIGPCEDWTEVNFFSKLVPIVALVSGRIFVGEEMCRDPEYLRCIIAFTVEVFNANNALQQWQVWLYPFVYRFIPQIKTVWKSHKSMSDIMEKVLPSRIAALKEGKPLQDMVTWNLMNSPAKDKENVKIQAHAQLSASMAAIHTTSLTTSHIVYDLAARPEYVEPLRKELQAVLDAESVPWLTKTSTPKLKLLDSFCKESQRMNPLAPATFDRLIQRDITLHDGTVLPANTKIAVATAELLRDPELYTDPDTFDGFRFSKMRETPGRENLYQFVSTSIDNMSFGHGMHSCPGRFFANNELKVIVTYMLQHYDIKMPDGEGRPGNIITASGTRPDMSKGLLMRKRKV